jgi:hypothetical protein
VNGRQRYRDDQGRLWTKLVGDEAMSVDLRIKVALMLFPVRCTHCHEVYDAGKVTVTARYADCSVWRSPCCKRTVDDRRPPFTHRADIEEITR